MITFLEGLPRSGKSYSSMKDSIIPALQAGRKVFAYIEGLDHEKIAEVAGISLEKCRDLLRVLQREQVKRVFDHVENDSLVLLDEAQNFWPSGRQKLDEATTEFITEHGHRGLDIVLMGQSMKDVHALWRNRIERKIYFLKQTAIGRPNKYSATFYTVVPRGDKVEFEQIQSMTYEYEAKYFGLYKSHTDGTTNKETAIDKRAVVWNTPLFRRWLPIAAIVVAVGVGYLVWFFSGGLTDSILKKQPTAKKAKAVAVSDAAIPLGAARPPGYEEIKPTGQLAGAAQSNHVPVPSTAPALSVPTLSDAPLDVVEDLNKKGRIRFTGYVRIGNLIKGFFEWRDAGNNLLQSMTMLDLSGLGYVVMVNQTGTIATLTKGATAITAFAWPIDRAFARTSESDQAKIAGTPRGMQVAGAGDVMKPAEPERLPGY